MKEYIIDKTDRMILNIIQHDSTLSVQDIAEQINLTVSPCWRRIQNLESHGYIDRRVALLNREKLALGFDVFVFIKTNEHNDEWLESFHTTLQSLPEVCEAYRMSGDVDYLLRVVVKNIQDYDVFYKRLVSKVKLSDVSSSFAMERMKYTTALPI
jgi:Lrp/AsnC family transcriptional regulator